MLATSRRWVLGSTFLALLAPVAAQTRVLSVTGPFGWTTEVRDMDRDGYPDLLAGGFAAWSNSTPLTGAVRLRSGRDLRLLWEVYGDASNALLGYAIGTIADVDRDGYQDVIAGAPNRLGTAGGLGQVWLLSGRDGKVLATYSGDKASRSFGLAVVPAGDLDADGVEDLLVGAPDTKTAVYQEGRVYAVSGKTGGLLYTVDGPSRLAARFGCSLANLGDLDGDKHACGFRKVWLTDSGKSGTPEAGRVSGTT